MWPRRTGMAPNSAVDSDTTWSLLRSRYVRVIANVGRHRSGQLPWRQIDDEGKRIIETLALRGHRHLRWRAKP